MTLTDRDEVFYKLFKQECHERSLIWYYTENGGLGFVSFAHRDTQMSTFWDRCINLVYLPKGDTWFTAYTGLMKWVVEQTVKEVIAPGQILQVILDYGEIKGEDDYRRIALLIHEEIAK